MSREAVRGSPAPRERDKFLLLDVLRGVAAAYVFSRHTMPFWGVTFFLSYLAVDLFFVLSGFVICSAYGRRLEQGTLSIRDFIKIRLIRLYPVYFLAACISLIPALHRLAELGKGPDLKLAKSFVMTLLFLPSHYGDRGFIFPLNTPFWSLFYELIMNIVLAAFLARKRIALMRMATVGFAITTVAASFHYNGLDSGYAWGLGSIATGFSRAGFGIFVGYFLCRLDAPSHRRFRTWFGAAPVIAAVAAILYCPSFARFDGLFATVTVIAVFPAIIYLAAKVPTPALLRVPYGVIGEVSYPLYALLVPLGSLFVLALKPFLTRGTVPIGLSLLFAFSLGMLAISRIFDIPLRRALTKWIFGAGHPASRGDAVQSAAQ